MFRVVHVANGSNRRPFSPYRGGVADLASLCLIPSSRRIIAERPDHRRLSPLNQYRKEQLMRKAYAFLVPLFALLPLAWWACSKPEEPLSPSLATTAACSVTMTYLGTKVLTVSANSTNNNASWHVNNNGTSAVTLTGQTLSRGGAVTAVDSNHWAPFPYSLAAGSKIDADLRFNVGASGTGTVGMTVSSSCGSIVAPAHPVVIQSGSAPTVTTTPASSISTTKATLNGSANPNGVATTGWFRYSSTNPGTCSDTFGTRSPSSGGTSLGTGTAAVAYSRTATNLIGGTTYYFCAIANSSGGTGFGTVRSFLTGGTGLRLGLSGMEGKVGQGPGSNTAPPIYRYVQVSITPSTVDDDIAVADAQDIVLMANPSRNRGAWTVGPNCSGPGNPGDFVWACYEAKVREFQNDTMFARAVAQHRVLLFVVDEPNISTFDSTFTPDLVNQAALLHKQLWPTGLTFVRATPTTLNNGWDGHSKPGTGYTGVDYAWVAYSGQHYRAGLTPAQQLANEKTVATALNVGIGASLNIWAGGIKTNFDGVPACWDYLNNITSSGYVIGTPASAGYAEGQQVVCGTLNAGTGNVMSNPAWIRHYADVVSQNPDIPFAGMWTYPHPGAGVDWAPPYIDRPDLVSALDYAVNQAAARTAWVGYRTPKPPQP